MERKKAIIVIDDEPSVANALKLILTDGGYDVDVYTNGKDAVVRLADRRFDLVITDLRLPDMSGFDVLRLVRRTHPGVLAIVITAYCTPEVTAQSLSLGAVAVLPKPFSPTDLLTVIQAALSGAEHPLV